MGGFIYCFFGTSKDVTLGPTAIMSLMVAEFGSERSPVKHDPTYAIILTLFAGLIQFCMGLLNLGECSVIYIHGDDVHATMTLLTYNMIYF